MIPTEHQAYVDKLRLYLGDLPELNELLEKEESSDEFLYMCLEDALDEMNNEYEPIHVKWESIQKAPWSILKTGATLQMLLGKGIHSARNTYSYNDAGNIQIKETDVYGRYINFYNILLAKYARSILTAKRAINIDSTYGGLHSEYYEAL